MDSFQLSVVVFGPCAGESLSLGALVPCIFFVPNLNGRCGSAVLLAQARLCTGQWDPSACVAFLSSLKMLLFPFLAPVWNVNPVR